MSVDTSKIIFPSAVTVNVLQAAHEISEMACKTSLYISELEILETQGHELGFKEGLLLAEYKDLMENLPHNTKIQAKAQVAYEVLALAEIGKLSTLQECAALEDRISQSGKAHKHFAKRCRELQTSKATQLLEGPDKFRVAYEALSLLPWDSPLRLRAIEKLARSTRTQDESFTYVEQLDPQTSKAHFDEVFDRALGFCTTRDQLERFQKVLYWKNDSQRGRTWNEKEQAYYYDRFGEAIAIYNRSHIPNLREFDAVMKLKYEPWGSGPISREVKQLILARAMELANLEQLHGLLSNPGWENAVVLKTEGMKKWELLAHSEVERTSDLGELTALLEHLPPQGPARKICLLKIVELQTSPEAVLSFLRAHRNDKGISKLARARYEVLMRAAMTAAQTPKQITKMLTICDDLPDVRKEGVAKLAAFYRIPEARAA